ncbi:hypothetical protein GBAR_LOCUS16628 [Geodia barretti]|uniref:Fibronectin type-III domain-containing protein n=1 Tax=Geodia barretti TaxID=519541 RepID=A0AA35SHK5_GEOBA|nr:hypothetical protein GBAR_LOCUS16628 [Geodia barretti]
MPVSQELVVQWYPTLPPPPGTVFAYYQVQYRTIGEEGEGLTETVDAGQSRVIINQLENAHNYEIRLRVKVQVRRFPAEYEDTPWSVWITLPTGVQGVTMTPTEAVEESDREEVLLVWVLVPVLSVVVLVALLVPVTIIVWRVWKSADLQCRKLCLFIVQFLFPT